MSMIHPCFSWATFRGRALETELNSEQSWPQAAAVKKLLTRCHADTVVFYHHVHGLCKMHGSLWITLDEHKDEIFVHCTLIVPGPLHRCCSDSGMTTGRWPWLPSFIIKLSKISLLVSVHIWSRFPLDGLSTSRSSKSYLLFNCLVVGICAYLK